MSTAQKIFEKARELPEPAQEALLRVAEILAAGKASMPSGKPTFGSAKGLIKMSPEFDEPLEDFKAFRE